MLQKGKNITLKPCMLSLRELGERLGFIQITPRQLVEKESIDHGAAKVGDHHSVDIIRQFHSLDVIIDNAGGNFPTLLILMLQVY